MWSSPLFDFFKDDCSFLDFFISILNMPNPSITDRIELYCDALITDTSCSWLRCT